MQAEEQKIPESKKFRNEKAPKPHEINMQLIAETSLQGHLTDGLGQEQKIQLIIRLKSIHLQWLSISRIENLQVFSDLTVLYLQHNNIAKMQGLDHLASLQYVALNDNKITKFEGVVRLKSLLGLNLNNNYIEELQKEEFPPNLQLVSFKNNPVCLDVDYKAKVMGACRCLEMLDDQQITPADRFKTLGLFPQKLNGYANQMRQFYAKKQVEKQLKQENKMTLQNTQPIDQKQALGQVRAQTRKYLHQNKQTFKEQHKQQLTNFAEKIEVSRKIRGIKEKQQTELKERLQKIKETKYNQLMNSR